MDFTALLASKELTDVDFVVGPEGIPIAAHAAVVAARSSYIRNLLLETMASNVSVSRWVVSLPSLSIEPFRITLKFMYSDVLPLELTQEGMKDEIMQV